MKWLLLLLALSAVWAHTVLSRELTNEERQAAEIIDVADFTLHEVYTRIRKFLFKDNAERSMEDLEELAIVLHYMQNTTYHLAERLKQFDLTSFRSEEIRRQVRKSLDIGLLVLSADKLLDYNANLNKLKDLAVFRGVCHMKNKSQCNLAFLPDIYDIYSNSDSSDELLYYWEEWRKSVEPYVRKIISTFVTLYREVAVVNRKWPVSAQWYSKFEDPKMLDELTKAINDLMPLYSEFHAYVRHALNKKYGDTVVPLNEPIPYHLFEQAFIQAWNENSILGTPYPEKPLPDLSAIVQRKQFSSRDIVRHSDEFYNSLGMDPLPDLFWQTSIKELPEEEAGPDCKAEPLVFRTEITLKYCPNPTFRKWLQMHGMMAKIHYGFHRADLPLNLDGEACPGLAEALGESVILSASTPNHLQRIQLASEYAYDLETGLNRLFRMGVHTLFSVPVHFVHEKLTADLLDGKLNLENINCYYWDLMERYVGVKPPIRRSGSDLDMSYRFYIGLDDNAHTTNKLISEFLGYQFYKAFCIINDQYNPNNPSQKPLDNCDFSNNAMVGRAISDIMKQGSRKPWREVIRPVINEAKISSHAMMDYYEPLRCWLAQKNIDNNATRGWSTNDRSRLIDEC